jgi:hypothetical protein
VNKRGELCRRKQVFVLLAKHRQRRYRVEFKKSTDQPYGVNEAKKRSATLADFPSDITDRAVRKRSTPRCDKLPVAGSTHHTGEISVVFLVENAGNNPTRLPLAKCVTIYVLPLDLGCPGFRPTCVTCGRPNYTLTVLKNFTPTLLKRMELIFTINSILTLWSPCLQRSLC